METRVLVKKNTTWTFTTNGAMKETKSGKTYFPELAMGLKSTDNYIDELIAKNYIEYSKEIEMSEKTDI